VESFSSSVAMARRECRAVLLESIARSEAGVSELETRVLATGCPVTD